jgi:hypothetical protein
MVRTFFAANMSLLASQSAAIAANFLLVLIGNSDASFILNLQ